MLFSTRIATVFFAVALLGWGILHFVVGDFITGRAPAWPQDLPGKLAWAYATGVLVVVAAITIISRNRQLRLIVTCTGLLILAWAGGRNLFIVLSELTYGGVLTNFGKSITIGTGALLIAYAIWDHLPRYIYNATCTAVGIFFIIGGIQHFIFIDFVKTLVPAWIPGPVFWSYVAGAGLLAAGLALLTGLLRKLAAIISAYMVFTWFLVLHIPLAWRAGFDPATGFNEWIAVLEALAVSAVLTLIYRLHKS